MKGIKATRSLLLMGALMAVFAIVAIGCGSAATPTPAPAPTIDEGRLRSIVSDAVAASAPQQQEQVSGEEIQAMIQTAVTESARDTAGSQVTAAEIQAMVAAAVEGAAAEDASPEEIQAMVSAAVAAASADDITASDVQRAINEAVTGAQANIVTTEDIQTAAAAAASSAVDEALMRQQAADRAAQTVIFSDLNWPSAQIQNRIAQYIVEKGYGYGTDVKFGSTLPLFQGLIRGDTHVTMEIWLPNQNDPWNAALADGSVVSVGRSLGSDWQSAFIIPKYLQDQYPDLDSVEDLKEDRFKALFATPETGGKARLVSCVIGWSCEVVNAAQIEGYGLDDHVHVVNPGDGAAANADLYGAYERQEPWLGYQWGTNDPALKLDLVRLEEPAYTAECWLTTKACAYEDATILIAVNPTVTRIAPDVVDMLRKWDFNIEVFKTVIAWQDENPSADTHDAAIWWLNSNKNVWRNWVTVEAANGINEALSNNEIPDGWPTS